MSDNGCQFVLKVGINSSSCVSFGWDGQYIGPGRFKFALPTSDGVFVFTDHCALIFRKDGTPCESVLLDEHEAVNDAGIWHDDTVFMSVGKTIKRF